MLWVAPKYQCWMTWLHLFSLHILKMTQLQQKKTLGSLYTSFTIHNKRTLLVAYSWCFQKNPSPFPHFSLLANKKLANKAQKKIHLSLRCADWNQASSSTSFPIMVRDVRYPKAPNCSLQNPVRFARLVLGDPQQFAGSVHRAGGPFGDFVDSKKRTFPKISKCRDS